MAECRNPECRQGFTPGVVTAGKGTKNLPVLGATMRWGWVKCRACNPSENDRERGVTYQHFHRTPQEISERARLADSKATYDAKAAEKRTSLAKVAARTAPPPASGANQSDSGMVAKLVDQVAKLTEQVTELLTENRALRHRLDNGANGTLPGEHQVRRAPRKSAKKGGEVIEAPARSKSRRTLS